MAVFPSEKVVEDASVPVTVLRITPETKLGLLYAGVGTVNQVRKWEEVHGRVGEGEREKENDEDEEKEKEGGREQRRESRFGKLSGFSSPTCQEVLRVVRKTQQAVAKRESVGSVWSLLDRELNHPSYIPILTFCSELDHLLGTFSLSLSFFLQMPLLYLWL